MIDGTCVKSMLYFLGAAFLGAFGRYLYNSGVEVSTGTHDVFLVNGREEIGISVFPSAPVIRRSYGLPSTLGADDPRILVWCEPRRERLRTHHQFFSFSLE
jgi:hypothetical protein